MPNNDTDCAIQKQAVEMAKRAAIARVYRFLLERARQANEATCATPIQGTYNDSAQPINPESPVMETPDD